MRTPVPWPLPQVPTRGHDLRAVGITSDKLAGEVRRGTIVRLRRDIYIAASALPDDPRDLHLLRTLAEQTVLTDAVASHHSAALAWRLPLPNGKAAAEGPPSLTRRRDTRTRSGATPSAVIHCAVLPHHHVTTGPYGLRLTTRARTTVDVATGLDLPHALMVVDAGARGEASDLSSAPRRRDLEHPGLRAAAVEPMREALCHRQRGRFDLVRVMDLADPRRESPAESLSFGHMVVRGLPLPLVQFPIRTSTGMTYPDFLWPELALIGEVDGAIKYRTADDMLSEKRREQALRDAGYDFVRWTGKEIWGSPATVLDRIERALEARA